MLLLSSKNIYNIHERVVNPNELQGLRVDKSLESIILRIQSRIDYDLITDIFDLSAMYCVFIARGHIFNDANKRTAFSCMDTSLRQNNILITFEQRHIGDIIIQVAQGLMDEVELSKYLRNKYQEQNY